MPFLGWENELKEKNMKKILMTLMASMLLLSSTTYAVEMSKSHNPVMQMTTMSKSEAIQMLKDAGVEPSKIKMLENGEMAKTEGEFWWFLIPVLLGVGGGLIATSLNNGRNYTPLRTHADGVTFTYRF